MAGKVRESRETGVTDQTSSVTQFFPPTAVLEQLRRFRMAMIASLVLIGIALGTVVISYLWQDVSPSQLLRDPNAIAGQPHYVGAISQFGGILWAGTLGVAVLTSVFLLRQYHPEFRPVAFTMTSALLTVMLLLDDVYMGHEAMFPQLLGVPEKAVYAAILLSFTAYVVRFRRSILQSPWLFLVLALGGWAGSLLIDIRSGWLPISSSEILYFLEDGLKLTGIVFWSAFIFTTCLAHIEARLPFAARSFTGPQAAE